VSDRASTLNTRPFGITGLLSASIAAALVTAMIVMWSAAVMFTAVFSGVGDDLDPGAELVSLVAEHDAAIATARERFAGRSPFFPPPLPIREREDTKPVQFEEPKLVIEPKVLIYAGPSPIYAIGDTVWFKAPRQGEPQLVLNVGEVASDEVSVISTNLPWSIKVRWKGHEFDLNLFENKGEPFLRDGSPEWPTHPGVMPKYDDPFMTPESSIQPRQFRPRDQFPGEAA